MNTNGTISITYYPEIWWKNPAFYTGKNLHFLLLK